MGVANSNCYNKSDLNKPREIIILGKEYTSDGVFSPPIFDIKIKYEEKDLFDNIFSRVYLGYLWIATLKRLNSGGYRVEIVSKGITNSSITNNGITNNPAFTLSGEQVGAGDYVELVNYKIGDSYAINITNDSIAGNKNCNETQFSILFFRPGETSVSNMPNNIFNLAITSHNFTKNISSSNSIIKVIDNSNNVKGCSEGYCYSGNDCMISNDNIKVEVPIVYINAKTTIEGSDISDAIFTICDKYQYYIYNENKNECNTKCKKHYAYSDSLLQTKFTKTNLKIVKYLKGDCNTACEKLSKFYEKNPSEQTFLIFADNLMTYALIRYILSKILFGNFSMKYLLNKYNKKFIQELSKSRFCGGLEIFTDKNNKLYGYYKYFKNDLD